MWWLPFLIGQVCSQGWWRPYLSANFSFFKLEKFPWSPSKVEADTFYTFKLKVGSKDTHIIMEALVWSQQSKTGNKKKVQLVCNSAAKRVESCDIACFTTDVQTRLSWVAKRATSLFNSFCSNIAKQVAPFFEALFTVPLDHWFFFCLSRCHCRLALLNFRLSKLYYKHINV